MHTSNEVCFQFPLFENDWAWRSKQIGNIYVAISEKRTNEFFRLLSLPKTDHYDCKSLIAELYLSRDDLAYVFILKTLRPRFVHASLNCDWFILHKKDIVNMKI